MKVLVIGNGGREHALCWKLSQSKKVTKIFCAPGNGGISAVAELVPLAVEQIPELVSFARENQIDLTVIGPEVPLLLGIVDQFQAADLNVFGPNKSAALIEGSKSFAKDLMAKYRIPTAGYSVFTSQKGALAYLSTQQAPIVIKADGLAAGKGVVVAQTMDEAITAVNDVFDQGVHDKVVVEQYLVGEELSLMAFVDGDMVVPMAVAQDHKPVFNQDQGPNTGGMGAYSPVPQMSPSLINEAVETILVPTAKAMIKEGRPFTGVLYAGLMLTSDGMKVIEYNARFGDPETQVVLPRLTTDLTDVLFACVEHRLDKLVIEWSAQAAVSVVLSSPGYPGSYPVGARVKGVKEAEADPEVLVFHAGTKLSDGELVTAGGRVMAVTGLGDTIAKSKEKAYEGVAKLGFAGMHCRTDIGEKAL